VSSHKDEIEVPGGLEAVLRTGAGKSWPVVRIAPFTAGVGLIIRIVRSTGAYKRRWRLSIEGNSSSAPQVDACTTRMISD